MIRVTPFGAMGKIRDCDEYVKIAATDGRFGTFDRWVSDNMEFAATRGTPWTSHYTHGSLRAFVHSIDGATGILAGAIAPSADAAGRNYPLFVATGLEPEAADFASLELLPLALEDIWSVASRLLSNATTNGSAHELRGQLEDPLLSTSTDIATIADDFVEWSHSVCLDELEVLLLTPPRTGALASAVRTVITALQPHRDLGLRATRLSLRLPLGRVGGAAVCFWLGLVQRALTWQRAVPTFFWTHDGTTGELLLHVGVAARATLAQLWMPLPADDVVEVGAPDTNGASVLDRPDLEQLLATGNASVAGLLAAV